MSSVAAPQLIPSSDVLSTHSAGASDPGRVRENNEDRFLVDEQRGIYIVVDGVGGQAGGEVAAETALLQVRTRLERDAGTPESKLREAITLANNEVFRISRTNAEWLGMACVLTAAIVQAERLTIGHVGDSRLYKLRHGRIDKLTSDHSPVGQREDAGEIDEAEAMRHPRRNEVFRDVGSERHTPADGEFVEIIEAAFEADAALILCSDGLSDMVTSAEILATTQHHAGDPPSVVRELIASANRAGGKDNVTVVYVEGADFARAIRRRAADSVAPKAGTARRVLSHLAALLVGVVVGAAAFILAGDRLTQWLPGMGLPALNLTRTPRSLVVQQAAAAEFATIADALAAARPGDTVIVGPGEYREQLRLPAGVAMVSEILHRAVIRMADGAIPAPAVTVDRVRGASVRGFQIVGEPGRMQFGIVVLNGELELQDTRISGTSEAAVDIWGGTAVTLRANDLSDNAGVGVRIRTAAQPTLLHNTILRNGRGRQPAPGVLLDADTAPVLLGNVIADNGAEGIAGVTTRDSAEFLRNNVFVADAQPNARGALRINGIAAPTRR